MRSSIYETAHCRKTPGSTQSLVTALPRAEVAFSSQRSPPGLAPGAHGGPHLQLSKGKKRGHAVEVSFPHCKQSLSNQLNTASPRGKRPAFLNSQPISAPTGNLAIFCSVKETNAEQKPRDSAPFPQTVKDHSIDIFSCTRNPE